MLLVLDVGNTNTVLGVFARVAKAHPGGAPDDVASADLTHADHSHADLTHSDPPRYERLLANWRVATVQRSTVDEYGVLFRNLFSMAGLEAKGIHGIVVSSVVPPLDPVLRQVCERYFNLKPLFIEPGVKTGMPVHYDNPAEVGADRIVNAVAAFEKYGGPCVVVDFGTATTFDCVSGKGEYLGGVICPGIGISADALFQRTARLPRVEIRKPARVIGSNTVGSLQSGLYYGYLGLVDGILELLLKELGPETAGIATGGLGSMIGTGSKYIKHVDEFLTLEGLRIIWERNASARREPAAKAGSKAESSKRLPKDDKEQRNNKDKNNGRSAR
jgi:type III pantothenate kinase